MTQTKKQNFVFFFPDEMKASSVSVYGNPTVKMPAFDKLAEEGTLFENCITQNPVCSPSRCTLMSGLYVHNRGHRSLWHLLQTHEESLFRYLKNDGYNVKWYGKNDLYSKEYLDEVYDDYAAVQNKTLFKPKRKSGHVHGGENPFSMDDDRYYSFLMDPIVETKGDTLLDEHVARGLDFLESQEAQDKPFMLYLPTTMPHPVYNALESFHKMYDFRDVLGELNSFEDKVNPPEFMKLIRMHRRMEKYDKEFLAKIYAIYLGMNSYVDYMLGLLMETLKKKGLADNTTIIVSSDHGDWAGNFGLVEKWPNAMSDDMVRVPLLIKTPNAPKGQRIHGQVELFDIMPTVLELAGIDCTHIHFARSLVPELNGKRDDLKRPAFAEGGYDAQEPWCFENYERNNNLLSKEGIYYPKVYQQLAQPDSVCRTTMIRTLDCKLILRTSDDNELYDLKNDPSELINVFNDPDYREVRMLLESDLLKWYIKTSDTTPFGDDNRGFN